MGTGRIARWGAGVVAIAAAAFGLLGVDIAHAAPGDQVSATFEMGDFGSQRAGTTTILDFEVTNNGIDPVSIDPKPMASIAAPFAPVSTTLALGDTIRPGASRVVTVSYTAGAVGETKAQDIMFTAVSTMDSTRTSNVVLHLAGKSIATDPASFEVTTPAPGEVLDFGSVAVGVMAMKSVTIRNDGITPLDFDSGSLTARDVMGYSVPVWFSDAPFFTTLDPGESTTFFLAFEPVDAGHIEGFITLVATSGTVSVTRVVEFSASGEAVTPSPTPTIPAGAGTGNAGSGAGTSAGTAGRPGGTTTGTSGRTLASTGADSAGVFAGTSVALMLLVGGGVALVQRRRRAKA